MPDRKDRKPVFARDVLIVLADAMMYASSEGIVSDYLAGKPVISRIGLRGKASFDRMMGTIGCQLPEPQGW